MAAVDPDFCPDFGFSRCLSRGLRNFAFLNPLVKNLPPKLTGKKPNFCREISQAQVPAFLLPVQQPPFRVAPGGLLLLCGYQTP